MKMKMLSIIVAISLCAVAIANAQQSSGASWTIQNAPTVGNAATVSKAASTTFKHVADCVVATFAGDTSLAAAASANIVVRDGATGAGTIVWQGTMSVPATAGAVSNPIVVCPPGGLALIGTVNTAMTVEFSAGGTHVLEAVYLKGHEER